MSDDMTGQYETRPPAPVVPEGPRTPAPAVPDLRGGLRRLSGGLIAYGLIGLVVAAIALGALLWVNQRLGTLRSEIDTTITRLAATTENTTDALRDASRTAGTFSTTLDQVAKTMPVVSERIVGLRTDLSSLEAQLRAVSIFGATPLGAAADAVANISRSLEGIDTQLSLVGVALAANSEALAANSTSLKTLADSTDAISTRLSSGVVEDSVGDVQTLVVVTLLVFTALSLVPAIGALAFGVWLRRELARTAA